VWFHQTITNKLYTDEKPENSFRFLGIIFCCGKIYTGNPITTKKNERN